MKHLPNKENLHLTYTRDGDLYLVYIDNILYAVFDDQTHYCTVCLDTITEWVENTYYDTDFACDQYTASSILVYDDSTFATEGWDVDEYKITEEGLVCYH